MKLNSTSCSDDTKEILTSAIKALGASSLVQELEPFTHLIMEQSTRTLKILFALARGAWILSPAWILTSLENGKWVDEEPFETKAFTGASKSRKSREDGAGGLLENAGSWLQNLRTQMATNISPTEHYGLQIYVTENNTPSQEILTNLILTAGGKVVSNIESSDVCIAPKGQENKELKDEQEEKGQKKMKRKVQKKKKRKKQSSKSPKKKKIQEREQKRLQQVQL